MAVSLLLAVVPPTEARAQWGRLRDAARTAVRGASGAPSQPAPASSEVAPAATVGNPAFEITEARLAQLLRGLDAEVAARPAAERALAARRAADAEAQRAYEAQRATYDRAHAAWLTRRVAYEGCAQRVAGRHAGARSALRAEAGALDRAAEASAHGVEARLQALAKRAEAAQARGDRAAMLALVDTLQREAQHVVAPAMAAGVALDARAAAANRAERAEVAGACGQPAPEPVRPVPPAGVDGGASACEVRQAGARASGLAAHQYAVLRERVEEFVGRGGASGGTPGGDARFTAGELGVLGPRLDTLRRHPAFAERPWVVGRGTGAW